MENKAKHLWKKAIRLIIAVLILCQLAGQSVLVYALEKGNLTVHLEHKEYEVKLALYRVAEFVEDSFVAVSPFDEANGDINNMEYAEEIKAYIKELEKYTDRSEPVAVGKTENGEWTVSGLEPGLYLLKQVRRDSDKLIVASALVSVPQWSEGQYVTDVVVQPKSEYVIPDTPQEEKEESEPPEETETPDIPATPVAVPSEAVAEIVPAPSASTGDDSPVMLYLGVSVTALAAVLLILAKRAAEKAEQK